MSSPDAFLLDVQSAYRAVDGQRLAQLLNPLDAGRSKQLKLSLHTAPHLRPSSYLSLAKTFLPDNIAFAEFVAGYLLFVRDAKDTDVILRGKASAEDALQAFELFSASYSLALSILTNQNPYWFVPALRKLATALVVLAFTADASASNNKQVSSGAAARLLTRSLSICAAERSGDWPSKRQAVFFLANQTFRIYFKLNNLRLCDTVIANVRDTRDYLDSHFPKCDRVTFRYYMGRLYLYQRRPRKAMLVLREAFEISTSRQWKNRRQILTYLITASAPLGVFPKLTLLQTYGLQSQYADLFKAVKLGSWRSCLRHLNEHKQWHLAKCTYLFLREKLEVVCWRNLARRTLCIDRASGRASTSGPPTLSLKSLLLTARYAFDDESLEAEDIEAMCASLLDQGYVKAYVHQRQQLLVLQKGGQAGFPPVSSVRTLGGDT